MALADRWKAQIAAPVQQIGTMAGIALIIAILALFVAIGGRHGS